MKLRNVSIGVSSAVLFGVAWFYVVAPFYKFNEPLSVDWVITALFVVLFNGVPPIISILLSTGSKHFLSHIIAAMVSLCYGYYFVSLASYVMECSRLGVHAGLGILFVGFASLFFLPLWFIAVVIEIWHRRAQERRT